MVSTRTTTWLQQRWQGRSVPVLALVPLSWIYGALVGLRRQLYHLGVLRRHRLAVPVIIVGNVTVGGTGKTPLVIWLSRFLLNAGYRPGIITRGYGGQATAWPQAVTPDSDPAQVGDEPVLLARGSGCPVVAGPDRIAAAGALLAAHHCDVLISDDGLQHLHLARDIEIVVIDGQRRFGNGLLLPAGPLREPAARAGRADLRVTQGSARDGEHGMELRAGHLRNLADGRVRALPEFAGCTVHAVAGIGNPARFFAGLRAAGLVVQEHTFPDHHRFRAQDLEFGDGAPVIMTAKDAVKCERFARPEYWCLEAAAFPDAGFGPSVLRLLKEKSGG